MPLNAESRLALIRVKVERAKKHLAELEREISKSTGETLQVFCMKVDPKTENLVPYFGPMPISTFNLLAVAGDVVHNLRSALDHLAYHLAQVGTPNVEPSKFVAFPISNSAQTHESRKVRKLRGMSEDAKKAIDALKPYKGGNDALWLLHELDNTDKHSFLLTAGQDHLFFTGDGDPFLLQTTKPIFARVIDAQTQNVEQLSSEETLNKPTVLTDETLLPTLQQLVVFVDNLVGNFKPLLEWRRVGGTGRSPGKSGRP
jgi:hypothetical protein